MKVGILGAGPSGMFAAWACIQYGYDITLYDRNPEQIGVGQNHGVYALWDSCDLFLSQKRLVKTGVIGAKGKVYSEIEKLYSQKVYGNQDQPVSVSKYIQGEELVCYNHAEAYQQILDIIGKERIRFGQVKSKTSNYSLNLMDYKVDKDILIVTIPADQLFKNRTWPHKFAWIYHSTAPMEDSFMIYNVNEYIRWYRCSAIFGQFSMEYADYPYAEGEAVDILHSKKLVKVKKVMEPSKTPSELYQVPDIWFVGRFGAWDKECLTEDVYYQVLRKLSDRERERSLTRAI